MSEKSDVPQTPEAVAFALMQLVATKDDEITKPERKTRNYWLDLYAQCRTAVAGQRL